MSEIQRFVDGLGLFLSGGASNKDPDLALGGLISSTRIRGLGAIVNTPIPALRIDNVFPACGEGQGLLTIDANGDLVFTPPGGVAGSPVTIAAGESKIVSGVDTNKAVRVFREVGLNFAGSSTLTFLNALNGIFGMKNVTDAQRAAGVTTYRGLLLQAQGVNSVENIRLWTPLVVGAQATYSLGLETAPADTIQIIANELMAPAAVVFTTQATEGGALVLPSISAGQSHGLWVRKTFPVGTVAPQEDFQLAMKYLGA